MTGLSEPPPKAGPPANPTLTRKLVPFTRSRIKTSGSWFVSLGTRSSAELAKATHRPSALTDDGDSVLNASAASGITVASLCETISVVPATRSRTKTSSA